MVVLHGILYRKANGDLREEALNAFQQKIRADLEYQPVMSRQEHVFRLEEIIYSPVNVGDAFGDRLPAG